MTKILEGSSLTDLEQLFSKHGEIQSLKIVTDKISGELNGVALIKVKSEQMTSTLSAPDDVFSNSIKFSPSQDV